MEVVISPRPSSTTHVRHNHDGEGRCGEHYKPTPSPLNGFWGNLILESNHRPMLREELMRDANGVDVTSR